MFTWSLWRAINTLPNGSPLFHHAFAVDDKHPGRVRSQVVVFMFMAAGMGFCWSVLYSWIPFMIVIAAVLANTVYSLRWAVNISTTIAQERDHRRYDMLSMLPHGQLGASWAMCLWRLHRTQMFKVVQIVAQIVTIIFLITLAIALVLSAVVTSKSGTGVSDIARQANIQLIAACIYGIGLTLAFYLDHIQSADLSVLMGLFTPTGAENSSEARVRALAGFLTIQVSTYAISAVCGLVVLPTIYDALGLYGWVTPIGIAGGALLVFYGMRELIIRRLWRVTMARLNTDMAEFHTLTAPASTVR